MEKRYIKFGMYKNVKLFLVQTCLHTVDTNIEHSFHHILKSAKVFDT
jgi:hypothetical protein